MPHSSGGGSNSGTSHSSSSMRTGNRYFPNSRRFVYYRDHRPYYVYSNRDLREYRPNKLRYLLLLFYIPFVFGGVTNAVNSLRGKVEPLNNYRSSESAIIDNIDIISESEEKNLQKALDEFTETTGIAVTVYADNNTAWKEGYTSLENYSFNKYNDWYGGDEQRWLLMYTCDFTEDRSLSNWYWEGMQGDDTDSVLGVFLKNFNSNLQDRLMNSTEYSVGEAFTQTIEESTYAFANQQWSPDFKGLLYSFVFLGFAAIHCYYIVFDGNINRKYKYEELVEVSAGQQEPRTEICANCGGSYVADTHSKCPHCGAEIHCQSTNDVENTLFQ